MTANRDDARGAVTRPYEIDVGRTVCRELLVRTHRPMFDRIVLHERVVLGVPRAKTKNPRSVGFDVDSGRELSSADVDLVMRCQRTSEGRQRHGLRLVRRPAIGSESSVIEFYPSGDAKPAGLADVPDATTGVARTTFGWYVGCHDGYLYAFTRAGGLLWRWQTPGSEDHDSKEPADSSYRPCPYHLTTDGTQALVAFSSTVWCIDESGSTAWSVDLDRLDVPRKPRAERGGAPIPQWRESPFATTLVHASPTLRRVSALVADNNAWLVTSRSGELFRFDQHGHIELWEHVGTGRVFPLPDLDGRIAAFGSGRTVLHVDGGAQRLPDEYPWPYWLWVIGQNWLIAHRRPRDRHLRVIDERGQLVTEVRSQGAITDFDVGDDLLAFVSAGTLVVLDSPGLSRRKAAGDVFHKGVL